MPARPTLERERRWWRDGALVAGLDEVGRGAWAGPVTVAAVALPPGERMPGGLRDSKALTPSRREAAAATLRRRASGVGLGHAGNHEVDRLGLSAALRLAARRAVDALPHAPDVCLLDGAWDFLADHPAHCETVVRGDGACASIAAASVVAKVARDALMRAAAPRHPGYAFEANKGYASPAHVAGLDAEGPCALHRHSWAPVRECAQARLPC